MRDWFIHHDMLSTNRRGGGCAWLPGEKCVTHNVAIHCVSYHSRHSLLRLLFYRSRVSVQVTAIFWVPTPCIKLCAYRRLRRMYWLHFQGAWIGIDVYWSDGMKIGTDVYWSDGMKIGHCEGGGCKFLQCVEWMRLATCVKTQMATIILNNYYCENLKA